MITIGTNGRDFNDDSVAVAGGDKIDGGVIVYINGNPVSEYNGWGTFKQINQYIKKGKTHCH
ncbi:MAG: hypothetical protein KJ630_03600 [Proteobacteria bacterium]|nr:hypothetical protein [Pseudomonadota bacterium]